MMEIKVYNVFNIIFFLMCKNTIHELINICCYEHTKDVLSPEVIAEKIHEPVQYVLDVLKDDGTMYACEPEHPYNNK